MFFKDIPFKEKEKTFLLQQVTENRIPHAQIFLGNEGSGTLALARAFASYLVCTNKLENDSCGTCPACKQSHKIIYPDIHWSFPVVKADGKNRADSISDDFLKEWRNALSQNPYLSISDWQEIIHAGSSKPNINVKECSSIIQKLSLQSYADGPKVLILWLPEFLGNEGNRLLKLIEEPTPNTIIILVAEQQEKILNTILSRCQLVKVLPFSEEEITEVLNTDYKIEHNDAIQIASISERNLNKAIHIAKGEYEDLSEAFFKWLRISYKADMVEMHDYTLLMAAWSKDQQIKFFQYGLRFLREYFFYFKTNTPPVLNQRELDTANKMKSIITEDKIHKISMVLENAIINCNRNANMKIAFMADSILLGDILRNIDANLPKEINFV